jgi:hypothetical protein
MVWQIAAATGWSVDYILSGVNYRTLRMMLADAPHYEQNQTTKTKGTPSGHPAGDERQHSQSFAGIFQSKLNPNQKEE